MAEAQPNQNSERAMDVAVGQQPVTLPSGGQAPPNGSSGQARSESFWNGDPNTLAPELRKRYDEMHSDYTKKTVALAEERKQIDQVRREREELDRKYKELEGNWNKALPYAQMGYKYKDYLARMAKPEVWEKIYPYLNEQEAGAQTAQQATQPAAQTRTTQAQPHAGDDEYEYVPMSRFDAYVKESEERTKAEREWFLNCLNYYSQALNLELAHKYELAPKNPNYDVGRVIQTAAEKQYRDLNDAHRLIYGEQEVTERVTRLSREEAEKEKAEAVAAAKKQWEDEQALKVRNAQVTSLPNGGNARMEINRKPTSYKDISAGLTAELQNRGMRP